MAFLNVLREFLGLCPLPMSAASGKENSEGQLERDIGWFSAETDGNRRMSRLHPGV
jgi:hypothetical protein